MPKPWPMYLATLLLVWMVGVLLAPVLRGPVAVACDRGARHRDVLGGQLHDQSAGDRAGPGHRRLAAFIVPVPANGPENANPLVYNAALELLEKDSAWVRWLPDTESRLHPPEPA